MTTEVCNDTSKQAITDLVKESAARKEKKPFAAELRKLEAQERIQKQIEKEGVYHEQAISILKSGKAFDFIMKVFHDLHVGDDELGRLLLVTIGCQSVLNTDGLNPGTTGESGKGKSDACSKMAHLVPGEYRVASSVSTYGLFYRGIRPGTVIFLDDASNMKEDLETIIKQTTSSYQQGYTHISVKQGESNELYFPPRCTWWLTSVDGDHDMQVLNRQLSLSVDQTTKQDNNVMSHTKGRYEIGKPSMPEESTDVLICREIIREMKKTPFFVAIPFVQRISWYNPSNRRNFPYFLDTICSFAAFNFMVRNKTGDGAIMATEEDFYSAIKLWDFMSVRQITKLTEKEIEVLTAIVKIQTSGRLATTDEIQKEANVSASRLSQILRGRDGDKGLLLKVKDLVRKDTSKMWNELDGSSVTTQGDSLTIKWGDQVKMSERKIVYTLPYDFNPALVVSKSIATLKTN